MVGRTIARYRVLEELGAGGMGVVYRAHDAQLERPIALKLLLPDTLADPTARARLLREARMASKLNHPHICTIHEVGESDDGQVYIAMELVEGAPLSARLAEGPLDTAHVLRYGQQLADALAHAHARGVIHRDLKSANVVITPEGRAKVLDFGLAKRLGAEEVAETNTRTGTSLTEAGVLTGTLAYMAPEQLSGQPADARSDIWALGIVLYEMAGGRRPFHGKTGFQLSAAILNDAVPPLPDGVPEALRAVVERCLAKNPAERYQQASDVLAALAAIESPDAARTFIDAKRLVRHLRNPRVAVPAAALLIAAVWLGTWFVQRQAHIRWAREQVVPEVERLIAENDVWRDLVPAYQLAEQAEAYIPGDPRLAQAFSRCSLKVDVVTDPPGAKVYFKEYRHPESEWSYLGVTPLQKIRLPIGIFRWKIEKDGYDTVMAAASTWDGDVQSHDIIIPYRLKRVLDRTGTLPPGMVRVENAEVGDFYIDRYEVTNKQFKEFVNRGGYTNRAYWKSPFVENGRELTWEQATARFVDQTGRLGPATWLGGDYPDGQGDYPVSGVSWYEAAAYAQFAGKDLPTLVHWNWARGGGTPMIDIPQLGGNAVFAPFSNFNGKGPVRVGSLPGDTAYGAFDMAGNIREWCWNETPKGRLVRGGAWDDNPYMFGYPAQAPAMDRSPRNGFRCATYPNRSKVPASAFEPMQVGGPTDVLKQRPVADSIFEVYKQQFAYDRTDLKSRVESRTENAGGWIREKVSFDAAYRGERVVAYLFLPKNATPPFETVIYVPGSASLVQRSSADLETYYEFPMFLSFVLKSGRAVMYPVYKGTFERSDPALTAVSDGNETHLYTEFLVDVVKDFRRSVDYLETRKDIDHGRIAYYGMSWGAVLGAIIPAVEERLRASVLTGAGLTGRGLPEANQINYVTRVRVPTLMIGGKYDGILDTGAEPMFNLLGTPAGQKQLKLYDTDHIPPRTEMIKETLAWLDRYLGPVK